MSNMAQETGLFTVRRPRETLGSINFNSAIPQPASALKRSNSISNLKTSTTPYTTARHGRSVSSSRMSLAQNLSRPRQPSFQRSSSGNNLGFVEQSFFAQAPIPASAPVDPRPLRNGAFQAKIGQEMLDYLTQNNFELDTKHALRQNMLKSPTTNDFNMIFQWLYHRIDPAYRFQKTIDAEVPPILKQLRYPYIKNISKSQLAAPGGQNWSTFLGLLHWMMQLAQMLDRYEAGQYDNACAEAGIDVSGDRIIFRFLSGAYRDWLQFDDADDENDDADKLLVPHIEAMAAEFERGNSRYAEEMQMSEAEHAALSKQIEEAERGAPDTAKLEKHFQILEDDKRKFEDYNASVEGKLEKYEARIKFLTEEIDRTEAELREAEQEKCNLQESVDRQGITIQDIDHMNTERERLQKMREATAIRLEEVKKRSLEQEIEASRALEDLERVVEKYNSLCYQIGLIPSTASNAKGEDFELCLSTSSAPSFSSSQLGASQHGGANSDRLLEDQNTGYHPAQLLQLDLRGAVKARFLSLRKEINERRTIAMDADMKNHELLDSIKEAIDDKKGEVETLQHRVRAAEEEFERTKEITSTQKVKSDAQIEKMEKELAKMRAGLTESLQLLEQREMNTNLECEQLTLHSIALREDLHTKTERILNDIIKFKVHIQKSLEDLEGLVVEEVERELGGDDEDREETQNGERSQWDGVEDRVIVGM